MKERHNIFCPICESAVDNKFLENIERNGRIYTIYFCRECNVGVTIPRPSDDDVSQLYDTGTYRATTGKRFNAFFEYLIYSFRIQRKRRIEKFQKSGRILDIGCGRGLFLYIMKRNGWDVLGSELNDETASYAREKYGISINTGDPLDWGIPDESIDVITINHVLEHLDNPVKMVSACKRLLKPKGLLVVSVPNINSLQASVGKTVWFHLDAPHHRYHFSESGLKRLLDRKSFRILKVRRFDLEYNIYGWLQTLLNMSGIREDFLFHMLKTSALRKNILADYKKRDVVLTYALVSLYFPLSVILSIFESFILQRGGTVELYAVKEQ
jgi:2-polyprenyl-3-methyl-5-hydroxy-6-metoxy-1,4-benzoquinol methylase